jgi:hypothetical protein
MSFATHPFIPSIRRHPLPSSHSSASSTSTSTSASSSVSSISSASSTTHSSPQSMSITASASKSPSALHHQPARSRALGCGTTSPLLMLVHPRAPIHTPIPPSLRDRRPSAPNGLPFTPPLTSEEPWYDNAEFKTPAGTPASAPCSACSSPLFDPRPGLPLRKSADSTTFPLHSQRH